MSKGYNNAVRRSRISFKCIDCDMTLLPKQYENHCKIKHAILPKTTCVWCRNITWKSGHKKHNSLHLIACLNNFLIHSKIFDHDDTQLKLMNSIPILKECYLYDGFQKLPVEEDEFSSPYAVIPDPPADEDEFFLPYAIIPDTEEDEIPLPSTLVPDPFPIEFRNENLNLAMGIVSHFMKCESTHEWYHVMIRSVTYKCFSYHVRHTGGDLQVVPFSCWCNGGKHPKIKYRQHRHLITCSTIGYFKKTFWPNIKLSQTDKETNYPCKRCKKIETPMHLVNTIGYLSQRKSRCNFDFKEKTNYQNNHFYLYKTLPEGFHLPLVLLFEEGLEALLYQQKFKNVSISNVAQHPIEITSNGRFHQRIKHFYGHEKGWVLPVSKTWMATNQKTDHFLYLMNGKKLYFKQDDENKSLEDTIWLEKQAQGGNMFYDNVEQEYWVPKRQDQKMLNYYLPMKGEKEKVNDEMIELKEKVLRQQTDMDDLQRKLNESLQKNETLQNNYNELIEKYEIEQKKNQELQNKINLELEEKCILLNNIITDLRKENERLNNELKLKNTSSTNTCKRQREE